MKKRLVCGMALMLVGLVQFGQADTIRWKADYLKLGKVDASAGGWGVERVIGETRGAGEFVMPVDTVIVAIGNESNPLIKQTTTGLETDKWGHIIVDANGKTSLDRVYAGGDIVLGAATVILAMGEGCRAAASINRLLANSNGK